MPMGDLLLLGTELLAIGCHDIFHVLLALIGIQCTQLKDRIGREESLEVCTAYDTMT